MPHLDITTDEQLRDYCPRLAEATSIGFDTEFVSEHTYRPRLCLVQVVADGQAAMIDAMTIEDMTPFWEAIAQPGHETIVHAGRGEVEFCLHAVGRPPAGLVDVQIAAGLVGIEYPAGYGSLISKLLGVSPGKHETRTDWRRRPLSRRQIEYAIEDVLYLPPLRDKLVERLESLGRLDWLREEMLVLAGRSAIGRSFTSGGAACRATRAWTPGRWPSSASCGGGANRRPSVATRPSAACSATT